MNPLVVISDPHFYEGKVRVGAHQYATVFQRHGWDVLYVTADFFLLRLMGRSEAVGRLRSLWQQTRLLRPRSGIINIIFAHGLYRTIRFALPPSFSSRCYLPSPRSILHKLGRVKADLLWLHGNDDFLHRIAWPHDKSIVRLFDHYHPVSPTRRRRMSELLSAADSVVACSADVRNEYLSLRNDIALVPNGVEFPHFSQPAGACPEWLARIAAPRILYVGAIASWFDSELLEYIAVARPELSFVLVGPRSDSSLRSTFHARNIHSVGPLPYNSLPSIMGNCQAGIVPFRRCKLVEGVSPIKVYEYLAAGLPTVSVYWRELELQRLPIFLARTPEEFLSHLDRALAAPHTERARLQRAVESCSWDNRLKAILKTVGLNLTKQAQMEPDSGAPQETTA